MCAIVDANVVGEVFGGNGTDAGQAFRRCIDEGRLQLVVGGKALDELDGSASFRQWREQAVQYGRVRIYSRSAVDERTQELVESGVCVSDDEHVIALALVSRARLLFSNDEALQRDFKDRALVDGPRGKVYTTHTSTSLTKAHRRLLGDRRLCAATN